MPGAGRYAFIADVGKSKLELEPEHGEQLAG
jgi:hypothetical protein